MAKQKQDQLTDAELQKLYQLIGKTQLDYKLEQYENKALKQINKSVVKARNELSKKLNKVDPETNFTDARLTALSEELQDLSVAIQAQLTGEISAITVGAGLIAYPANNEIFSFGGLLPDFNPVALSAAQLKAIVKTPVGGKQLNEWVKSSFDANMQSAFKSEITAGLLKGESYRKLVKRFGDRFGEMTKSDMVGLTRTYVQSINVKAMQDVANSNADVVKGWKWNSILENRTCIRCISLDSAGIVYKMGSGPPMPLHVRCRCVPEIVTKSFRELGIDVDEMRKTETRPFSIRGNIDPVTGKFTKNKVGVGGQKTVSVGKFLGSYPDFFKSQTKAVQVSMLGPSRYNLWKSGKIKLSDMTDKNGNTILLVDLPGGKKSKSAKVKPVKKAPVIKPAAKEIPTNKSISEAIEKDFVRKEWLKHEALIKATKKEAKRLEDEFVALVNEDINDDAWGKRMTRNGELQLKNRKNQLRAEKTQRKSLDDAIKKAVYPNTKGTVNLSSATRSVFDREKKKLVDVAQKGTSKTVSKGKLDLENMIHQDVLNQMPNISVSYNRGKRASFSFRNNTINMGNQNATTLIHEYGHAIEHNYKDLQKKATEFRNRRVGGEKISTIFKGTKEKGWKDRFFDHYCGKYYAHGSTEIVSMGLQQMHENPYDFFKQDPEYFSFIKNIMWGNI